MIRYIAWLLFLSSFYYINSETYCPIVNTYGEDRRTNLNNLTIMQYNIEWAFLDYYENADCPGNGCVWVNETQSLRHLENIANIIKKINPDIINFCEIEGCDELNYLKQRTSHNYNEYLIKGTDSATGQNVGMLTKIDPLIDLERNEEHYNYPIKDSNCGYEGDGSTGVSKHFITTFNFNSMKIAYISIHLIAYPTQPDRCAKREAQAKIIQNTIESYISNGYEIIVIGDFNDYDKDIPDINNSIPTSQVLQIIKGYQSSLYNLTNLNGMIKPYERYSNWWDKNENCVSSSDELVMIDHILVTDKIKQMVKNVFMYQNYDMFCNSINSDHYPIIVNLMFN